ncbi:hypothetical protein [Nodularia spumigena]|uniref:Uncharacterized protein n=1 Tax=Nodularia spumigena UHCC 0060 TaxID=3110300 RepID=A0ABU5UUQ8_NODSP|nr:hypothetical protein [Nodularia spumigena]MEA5523964.1 hypothetical protein [Nodularia spumigena UHCC 0143]MEA5610048.1 hypothetical protein [Nodularia spumigena UHCC 0060]MEA5611961.1 hypothetical protein [Nodularia spumigena UHCC 0040]
MPNTQIPDFLEKSGIYIVKVLCLIMLTYLIYSENIYGSIVKDEQ